MNGITVVLIALAIHAGGVEVDTTREAELQWLKGARPHASWTMATRQGGVYRFSGPSGDIIVQRLAEPDVTFAVSGIDSQGEMVFISVVSLPRIFNLGVVSMDEIMVAFAPDSADSETPKIAPAEENPSEDSFTVQRSGTLVTAGYPPAGEVILLRF